MYYSDSILLLRGPTDSLLMGLRAAFGLVDPMRGQSEDAIRIRLLRLTQDLGSAQVLRRFSERWLISGDVLQRTDQALIEQVAHAVRCGQIVAYVIPHSVLAATPIPDEAEVALALSFRRRGDVERSPDRPRPAVGIHRSYRSVAGLPSYPVQAGTGPYAALSTASPGQFDTLSLEGCVAELLYRAATRISTANAENFRRLVEPGVLVRTVAIIVAWVRARQNGWELVAEAVLISADPARRGHAFAEAAVRIGRAIDLLREARLQNLDQAAENIARAVDALGADQFRAALELSARRVTAPRRVPSGGSFDRRSTPHPPRLPLPPTSSGAPPKSRSPTAPTTKEEWKTKVVGKSEVKLKDIDIDKKKYGHSNSNEDEDEDKDIGTESGKAAAKLFTYELGVSRSKSGEIWKTKNEVVRSGAFEFSGTAGIKGDLSGDLAAGLYGSAKVAVIDAKVEGKILNDLVAGELQGEILAGSAVVALGYAQKDKFKGVEAKIGAEIALAKISGEGKLNISPKTLYDCFCGTIVRFATKDPKRGYLDPKWDHGVKLGAAGEAGLAAAVEGSARAGLIDGSLGASFGAKLGAGPMAGFKIFIGVY
ncbi:hypothetical protein AFCDBAGC_4663 [Methylobacterium cerastii]|uniref:Uncharacterized protein n=1 Tax=Methylobacterium cerastii TaxID=932741 RepID=A0ABQ4QP04_9HYPH|nr:hypothetical protein [Methylobacterium cerastii]GJD46779.1 hypothetical protein AFCDBAGC_4663 [Methylobacterium cerastii]